ncbi:MAG: ANTAR domain-containing protein [Bacillota bacterium]
MHRGKFDYCIGTADPAMKRQVTAMFAAAGFYMIGTGSDIPDLLRTLRSVQPWLVIVDMNIPPGNVKQVASIIEEDALAAAVYLGPEDSRLEQYVRLPWPVEAPILTAVAEALCLEFAQKKKLRREIAGLKQKLAERREIEKAKGKLMEEHSLSEEAAFRHLRDRSMAERVTLAEAARKVLSP